MKTHKHFITVEIDDSIPDIFELGTIALFSCLVGMLLAVVIYVVVFYA